MLKDQDTSYTYLLQESTIFSENAIRKIEEQMKSTYLIDLPLKMGNGNYTDGLYAIFYQPHPNKELGHTHYFSLTKRPTGIFISKGDSAFEPYYCGMSDSSNQILISRYRHEYIQNSEGNFIDGGLDYIRTNLNPNKILKIKFNPLKILQCRQNNDNILKFNKKREADFIYCE